MSKPAIRFSHVVKAFAGASNRPAIQDLDFEVEAGEYVCIVGRTGCGKSTTVNLVLGLDRPTQGHIEVLGHDPVQSFAALRGRIGTVFQSDRLLPWRTAVDNVRVPLEILRQTDGVGRPSAMEWMDRVGLAEFAGAYPHELSGGMRQRVALARALVSLPDVLVADEAFGHLDEVTARSLRSQFKEIARAHGNTVLHITHSLDEAVAQADRILVFGRPGHVAAEFRVADHAGPDGKARLLARLGEAIEAASALPSPRAA